MAIVMADGSRNEELETPVARLISVYISSLLFTQSRTADEGTNEEW
jgi:hypothetical protein